MRTLGPIGTKLIHKLAGKGQVLFTLEDAMKITGNGYITTKQLIWSLTNKNWIMRIKRGSYVILPLETGMENFNPYNWFVIARELIQPEPYYISYYSAMSIHNMVTQPLNTVYIVSPLRRRDKNIGATKFKFVYAKKERLWGFTKEWVTAQEQVQVSDLERTIIDCLYMPEYCGGISEIAKGIWITKDSVNYKKLYEYTDKFKKTVVAKRLGFILETYGIDKDNIIALLHNEVKKHRSYPLLDPVLPDEGKYIKHWGLKVNLSPAELKAVVQT